MHVPSPDEVIATARTLAEMADGFRIMQERLGLSNRVCDDLAGFSEGHTNKLLGPSRYKTLGPLTLETCCSLFAVEWRMYVDLDQMAKMAQRFEARDARYVQPLSRPPSKETLDRARPFILAELAQKASRARWNRHGVQQAA